MVRHDVGLFFHVQLEDLFRMAVDEVLLKEFTLFLSWLKLGEPDENLWAPIHRGGKDLVEIINTEIIAKKVHGGETYKVKKGEIIVKMTRGQLWRHIHDKCQQQNLTTNHLFTTLLYKYYSF